MKKLRSSFLLAALILSVAEASADDVTFDGRNFLEGELKHMERGKLYFKTPATDTIYVEWDKVISLTSQQTLEVGLQNGRLLYGSLEHTEIEGQAAVRRAADVMTVRLLDIVRITPIEDDFLSRFDGSLNAGISATKTNNYRQLNFGLNLEYVTRQYETNLSASHISTDSEGSDSSSQSQLAIQNYRKLANRWRTGALFGLDRNEEQGIDLRTSLGWGVGRALVQNNSQRLIVQGGLLVTRENTTDSDDDTESIESFAGIEYQLFRYNDPELDLTSGLQVIPGLTDWGRVRGSFNITLSWEIVGDLNWQLSFVDTYDSAPPGEDSSKNDYSVVTGLSWDL